MNVLVTSSRAPVALELARAFGRAGHAVFATDTMRHTMGSHSRYLRRHIVTPPPRHSPERFAQALLEIIERERIDWLIPTSEEVFWVARFHAALSEHTNVFTEPLAVLDELHHKGRFQALAGSLGIRTPRTALVNSPEALRDALPQFPRFLLKPAYSRFGARVITNAGPRAGQTPLAECRPTPAQPWLVQEYIDGPAVCSYSTLHGGDVTAHCAYAIPRTVDHGSGVQFRSVDGAATLAIARRLGEALGYTGQLSLDFIQHEGELFLLECNPRTTSGAHLINRDALIGGLTQASQATWVAPAGQVRQLSAAMILSYAGQPRHWLGVARDLALVRDVVFQRDDPLPALVQLRAGLAFAGLSRRLGIGLSAAMTEEIEWNGEALPLEAASR